ncbi:MAG TPA: carboxyltransferase domain-containing protein, partial [Polyangiaceae bacterium]
SDGGDAGLHPSNLHDNAYAVGTVDFTGDMPILLGPDGPSLGGFVCPATVIAAERWKLGQLKPDARVRFEPRSQQSAALERAGQTRWIEELTRPHELSRTERTEPVGRAVLRELPKTSTRPQVAYRPCGDEYLLVEYGPMMLDLALRFRVHSLMQRVRSERRRAIIDLTPGIRSLQLHYDPSALPLAKLLDWLQRIEDELPSVEDLRITSRIVNLPLSFNDPQARLAVERYTQGVRPDAPWAPSNIEFIRRINGLVDEDAVRHIVFDANYLVLGLGDVYLGAPVATPLDPRHRLVTTKYNPARTWTPENAVGIGGAYLCIYGMEGPGGYQLVGRTLQMFNRWKSTPDFPVDRPWLLQFFDQIRFYPVSAQELLEMRAAFPHGKIELDISEAPFSFAEHLAQLERDSASIAQFRTTQRAAFEAERQRWKDAPEFLPSELHDAKDHRSAVRSDGADTLQSHVHGCVWKVNVGKGSRVRKGDVVLVVESMKAELEIQSPVDGTVNELLIDAGQAVSPGRPLLAILRDSGEPMLT